MFCLLRVYPEQKYEKDLGSVTKTAMVLFGSIMEIEVSVCVCVLVLVLADTHLCSVCGCAANCMAPRSSQVPRGIVGESWPMLL